MRVLLLILLLANLLFFSWAKWLGRDQGRRAPVTVPALVLAPREAVATSGRTEVCHQLGPIASEADASVAEQALSAMQLSPTRHSSERQVPQQYLVYLAAPAAAADQRRLLGELRRAGIADAAVVATEAGERRISVGVFSEQAGATARAQAVREAGLRAETEVRYRVVAEYALRLGIAPGAVLPPVEQIGAGLGAAAWGECPAGDSG